MGTGKLHFLAACSDPGIQANPLHQSTSSDRPAQSVSVLCHPRAASLTQGLGGNLPLWSLRWGVILAPSWACISHAAPSHFRTVALPSPDLMPSDCPAMEDSAVLCPRAPQGQPSRRCSPSGPTVMSPLLPLGSDSPNLCNFAPEATMQSPCFFFPVCLFQLL